MSLTNNFSTPQDVLPYKAEILINILHEKYAKFILQSEVLLLIVNEDFGVEFTSDTFCDLLHYPNKSLIDKTVFSIISPESHQDVRIAIESIKHQPDKTHRVQDISLYCVHGYQHFFDGLVMNLQDDNQKGGFLFYLHNATERRKIEVKLKDLNLELDSFVYKASHDLRAPLASLAGLIALTEMDFPIQAKGNFDMMKKSVQKLDKFVQQLAHYSRNENIEANLVEIDFQNMIEEIIEAYKHLNHADKIQFDINIQATEKFISDDFRLKVILSNLISNAIKYHQTNQATPFIKISIIANEADCVIVVEDNGIGIKTAYLDKIFDMFTRATDYAEGSGLGLYITKKALEKLKATISVASTEGKGTTFEIWVPNFI